MNTSSILITAFSVSSEKLYFLSCSQMYEWKTCKEKTKSEFFYASKNSVIRGFSTSGNFRDC